MSTVGGNTTGNGPFRIDLTPQSPMAYAQGQEPRPDAIAANSPHTLIGEPTPDVPIEVADGWAFLRPAETPDRKVPQ